MQTARSQKETATVFGDCTGKCHLKLGARTGKMVSVDPCRRLSRSPRPQDRNATFEQPQQLLRCHCHNVRLISFAAKLGHLAIPCLILLAVCLCTRYSCFERASSKADRKYLRKFRFEYIILDEGEAPAFPPLRSFTPVTCSFLETAHTICLARIM